MGAPYRSIVVNELVQVGLKTIIRVGTRGGFAQKVKIGDLGISQAALCRQGAANDIAPGDFPVAADPFFTMRLVAAAISQVYDYHFGVTASVDTFFEGQERRD